MFGFCVRQQKCKVHSARNGYALLLLSGCQAAPLLLEAAVEQTTQLWTTCTIYPRSWSSACS